jgi:hypothetical protein
MKRQWTIALILMVCGVNVHAQDSYFFINWDVNAPLTNKEWIGNTSTRGAKVGFRKFLGADSRYALGVDVNWAYFQEYKPRETFQTQGGAITTDYFNDLFQVAITAQGQYHFAVGKREHIFPYAGIGIGASRNDFTVSYNIYQDEEYSWGFLARPEAGVLIRFGTRRKLGAMAAVHYDYSTAKSDNYDYKNFSSIGFQVGVMFMTW